MMRDEIGEDIHPTEEEAKQNSPDTEAETEDETFTETEATEATDETGY